MGFYMILYEKKTHHKQTAAGGMRLKYIYVYEQQHQQHKPIKHSMKIAYFVK